MKRTADNLTPDDYFLYRVARWGAAGKDGKEGALFAATCHGVTVRAWFYYESGARQPKTAVRQVIADWINEAIRTKGEAPGPDSYPMPDADNPPESPPT